LVTHSLSRFSFQRPSISQLCEDPFTNLIITTSSRQALITAEARTVADLEQPFGMFLPI